MTLAGNNSEGLSHPNLFLRRAFQGEKYRKNDVHIAAVGADDSEAAPDDDGYGDDG